MPDPASLSDTEGVLKALFKGKCGEKNSMHRNKASAINCMYEVPKQSLEGIL